MEGKREELERMGESEELRGPRRRVEVEKRKKDIGEYRVKVSYSMPLWLREKINKESLEQGLYQWEYIAKMIKRAENCPEDSNYEQLREENERLKKENEQLKLENERLRIENEQLKNENRLIEDLKLENRKLRNEKQELIDKYQEKLVELSFWKRVDDNLDFLIQLFEECVDITDLIITRKYLEGDWDIDVIKEVRKDLKKAIKLLKERYKNEENYEE
jgi:regulator of replication initiation timing